MAFSLLVIITLQCLVVSYGFSIVTTTSKSALMTVSTTTTQLHMGLFDGVKEAFAAPARTTIIDAERETPIDRWMGWSVTKDKDTDANAIMAPQALPVDYVDSMDVKNYFYVELTKPMGIIFEENDADFGGIFVHSLKENGAAASLTETPIMIGDQLVAVQQQKVSGLPFDEALGAITATNTDKVQLLLFRGSAPQLYGPTGASQEWLGELIAGNIPK